MRSAPAFVPVKAGVTPEIEITGRRSAPRARMNQSLAHQHGFTLVELLLAMVLAAILIAGLSGVTGQVLATHDHVTDRNELNREARFAMDQMVRMVSQSRQLMLPQADRIDSNWPENIREQRVPASAPVGDSTLATAVLAVTLPASIDLDGDGFPDADNDRDGKIDEDLPGGQHQGLCRGHLPDR